MNENIEKIIADTLVREGGFQAKDGHLSIARATFQFDSLFEGPDGGNSIVLIKEVTADDYPVFRSRIRSLVRSLARSGANRSLTIIVTGATLPGHAIRELESFCRVIHILADSAIRERILELLPISIPESGDISMFPEALLKEKLSTIHQTTVAAIIDASRTGKIAVEDAALKLLEGIIDEALKEEKSRD
jgi:hypothetical protein